MFLGIYELADPGQYVPFTVMGASQAGKFPFTFLLGCMLLLIHQHAYRPPFAAVEHGNAGLRLGSDFIADAITVWVDRVQITSKAFLKADFTHTLFKMREIPHSES